MPASFLLVSGRCEFDTSCPWSLWLGPTPTSVWFLRGFYFCCFFAGEIQSQEGIGGATKSHALDTAWAPPVACIWRQRIAARGLG